MGCSSGGLEVAEGEAEGEAEVGVPRTAQGQGFPELQVSRSANDVQCTTEVVHVHVHIQYMYTVVLMYASASAQ